MKKLFSKTLFPLAALVAVTLLLSSFSGNKPSKINLSILDFGFPNGHRGQVKSDDSVFCMVHYGNSDFLIRNAEMNEAQVILDIVQFTWREDAANKSYTFERKSQVNQILKIGQTTYLTCPEGKISINLVGTEAVKQSATDVCPGMGTCTISTCYTTLVCVAAACRGGEYENMTPASCGGSSTEKRPPVLSKLMELYDSPTVTVRD